jgi:hypothetical protein
MRPPKKKNTMSHPPCLVCCENSMTLTKIITIGVGFLFQKQIGICEAILVEMTCKSLKIVEIDQTKAIFHYALLKMMLFKLQWSDFNFE